MPAWTNRFDCLKQACKHIGLSYGKNDMKPREVAVLIYRELGKTGVKVSALGFGAMRLPMVSIGDEDYVDLDKAVDTIRFAFQKGVNYIDSGFGYCSSESEIAVGRALKGWREKVTVNTKASKPRIERPGDLRRML